MKDAIVERIKVFADLRWPDRDLPGRLRKLGEEFGELAEAVCYVGLTSKVPEDAGLCLANFALEIADCAIILQDMLIVAGCEGSLICYMDIKMDINEQREWPDQEETVTPKVNA